MPVLPCPQVRSVSHTVTDSAAVELQRQQVAAANQGMAELDKQLPDLERRYTEAMNKVCGV